MSVRLKEDESILTQCQLQEFTATLTNSRLIIISPVSEENFPLRGVSGVGVYEDVEKYKADLKAAKQKAMKNTLWIAVAIGFVLDLLLSNNGQILLGLASMIGAVIIGAIVANQNVPMIKIESVLNIMQHGGTRQFRFHKTDTNAASIKDLVQHVTETLS